MKFNSIALFVLLCGLMTAAIAFYAYRRRFTLGAKIFSLFMVSMSIYILGYAMELASLNVNTMLFWSKIEYIGILFFPSTYLIFCIEYTGGERWLTRRNFVLLLLVPSLLMLVKFLDDQLHWIYASATVDISGLIPLLAFQKGPLYMFVTGYNLMVVTIANYLLVQKWRFASSLYRGQTTILLVAGLFVYFVYGLYQTGIPLIPGLKQLDLNPFVYTLWGLAIGLSIFRYRLFDLAPIARDVLIEKLNDGVIVLDNRFRVVDANPQAVKIFGWTRLPVGQPAEDAMANWINLAVINAVDDTLKIETSPGLGGEESYFETVITLLKDKFGKRLGCLIVVHDITERKKVEKELHELSLMDELTGLTNRRGFKMLAGQLLSMTGRMKTNAVLVYLDLDRLKWINDHLGHAQGDQALKDTSAILKTTFRTSDIVARVGGDEFVVLALETVDNSGEIMLTRLQEQLELHNAQTGRSYELSFSVGLARSEWQKPISLDDLLAEADKVMYENKQAKKGRISL
jgi:diguanylate cyclase (GGDEF)-like protein